MPKSEVTTNETTTDIVQPVNATTKIAKVKNETMVTRLLEKGSSQIEAVQDWAEDTNPINLVGVGLGSVGALLSFTTLYNAIVPLVHTLLFSIIALGGGTALTVGIKRLMADNKQGE